MAATYQIKSKDRDSVKIILLFDTALQRIKKLMRIDILVFGDQDLKAKKTLTKTIKLLSTKRE